MWGIQGRTLKYTGLAPQIHRHKFKRHKFTGEQMNSGLSFPPASPPASPSQVKDRPALLLQGLQPLHTALASPPSSGQLYLSSQLLAQYILCCF